MYIQKTIFKILKEIYDRKVTEDLFELNQESKSRGHAQKTKKSSKCQETFLYKQNCGHMEQPYGRYR